MKEDNINIDNIQGEKEDESLEDFWDEYNALLESAEKAQKGKRVKRSASVSGEPPAREGLVEDSNASMQFPHDESSLVKKIEEKKDVESATTAKVLDARVESPAASISTHKVSKLRDYLQIHGAIKVICAVFVIIFCTICYVFYQDRSVQTIVPQGLIEIENVFGNKILIDTKYTVRNNLLSVTQRKNEITNIQFVLAKFLKSGDTVIDVGSGFGIDAFYIRHFITSSGSLYCFEGQDEMFKLLEASVKLNNFTNVYVYNKFAFNSDVEAQLSISNKEIERYKLMIDELEARKMRNITKVHTASLDNILRNVSSVDLIHINTHNSEVEILKGANHIIARSKNIKIITDWHMDKKEKYKYKSLVDSLISMDFNFWIINRNGALVAVENPKVLISGARMTLLIVRSIEQ